MKVGTILLSQRVASMRKCPVASLNMTEGLLLLILVAVPKTFFHVKVDGKSLEHCIGKNEIFFLWNHSAYYRVVQTCVAGGQGCALFFRDNKQHHVEREAIHNAGLCSDLIKLTVNKDIYFFLPKDTQEKWNCFSFFENWRDYSWISLNWHQLLWNGKNVLPCKIFTLKKCFFVCVS